MLVAMCDLRLRVCVCAKEPAMYVSVVLVCAKSAEEREMNGIIAYKLAHFSIAQHHRHMIACQVSFHTMVCSLLRANMGSDNRSERIRINR